MRFLVPLLLVVGLAGDPVEQSSLTLTGNPDSVVRGNVSQRVRPIISEDQDETVTLWDAESATEAPNATAKAAGKKRWLSQAGFGLMFHYEVFSNHTSESYNKVVESFKVIPFADAVESTKARYVIFTVGQHWGKFCAPNATYERLLGVKAGVWTSRRDLIMEIAKELKRRDIRLILYMTARAPMRHYKIIKAMGDALPTINGKPAGPGVNTMSHPRKVKGFRRSENQAPPPTFLKNWGSVCGEWSIRYGSLVSGWWFDGYKMEMKNAYQGLKQHEYNIDTWVTAVRSGNPDTELAFNAGAHPILSLCTRGRLCPHQTFTAGENQGFHQRTKKGPGKLLTPRNFPAPDGVIWHLLLPVSKGWGAGVKSRFDEVTLKDRIRLINSQGGVVTLDVPVSSNGTIPREILDVLQKAGQAIQTISGRESQQPTRATALPLRSDEPVENQHTSTSESPPTIASSGRQCEQGGDHPWFEGPQRPRNGCRRDGQPIPRNMATPKTSTSPSAPAVFLTTGNKPAMMKRPAP